LNIKDNGSSLFSVSENQITSALPHQFTSSGDVSIAYDLIFTNQTSSNIKSYGPLTIEAGENFESNDLILKTYNKGNVIIDTSASSVFDVLGQLSVDSYATIGASLAIGNTSAAAGPGNLNLTGDITGEEDNKIKIGYFIDAANEDFGLDPAAGNAIFNGASLKVSAGALLAVNSGNVGIGTTSPGKKLTVVGTLEDNIGQFVLNNTSLSTGAKVIRSATTATSGTGFYFYDAAVNTDSLGVGGTQVFSVRGDGQGYFAGNVGIGTTNPQAKLDIVGNTTALTASELKQSNIYMNYTNSNTNYLGIWFRGHSTSDMFFGRAPASDDLIFSTANQSQNELVRIKQNGYVGIGTTSPSAKLAVSSGNIVLDSGYNLYLNGVSGGSLDSYWYFGKDANHNISINGYSYGSRSFQIRDTANSNAIRFNVDFGTGSSYFNGGNVGIGTTTPNQKLDVRGSIVTGVDGSGGVLILAATDSTNEGGQIEWHGASTSSDWYQDIYLNRFRIWSTASSDTLTLNDWGNVGIGVAVPNAKLQVNGIISTGGSYVMRTYSSSTVPTRNNNGEFGFYRSGSTSRLYYRAGGTNYYINSSATGDFSEYFLKNNQSENFITGQIVSLNGDGVKKTTSSGESPLGVISAFGTRNFDDRQDGMRHLDNNYVNVAIIGQAPVLVTSENGPINPGDKIVSGSNYAGFGVRKSVIKSGQYISIAKQKLTMNDTVCSSVNNIDNISWPKDIENYNQENICYKLPNGIYVGRIMSYINSSWDYVAESDNTYFDPYGYVVLSNADQTSQGLLTSIDDIRNATYNIMDSAGNTITKLDSFAQIMVGKITSGLVETTNAIVNNVLIAKYVKVEEKITSPIVETEEIQLKAQNSKLKTTTENSKVSIVDKDNQTTVEFDTQNQQTSIFGNLNIKNDSQKGKLAKLIIDGLDGKTAASIDSSGNATFSGTIAANEATISGKLYAKEIESSTIDSLSSNISSQSSTIQTLASSLEDQGMSINEIQALLAEIRDESLTDLTTTTDLSTTTNLSSVAVSTDSATLASLTVTSSSNLYDVSVANSLAVGNILIENDKILSFSWNLKFSALSTVDFFDSAVVMAKDGTITTQGSLIALGGVKTNNLSAVNENDDISVKLGNSETENSLKNAKLKIENSVGDEVASIDASGSAKFKELALEQFNPATPSAAIIAASANFAKNGIYAPAIETATASAGVGILPANEQEVLIYNDRIYDNSLIYLTPVDQTDIKLSVVKKEKYFKVVTDETSSSNVKFNWLIIN